MKRFWAIVASLLVCATALAQTHTIEGVVTDASDGTPLIGVTVSLEGTSIVTISDYTGHYSLTIPFEGESSRKVTFSYMGR